mgnify:CR=1 FL=1
MIDQEYLEKYCIKEVNKCGKKLRQANLSSDSSTANVFRMNAFSEVLAIIAQAVAYEDQQTHCSNEHDSIVKDKFRK